MPTPHAEAIRKAAVALIIGALITAVGGFASQIVQASTRVSDELWRYPWSSEAFVLVSLLWALAHGLVIVGLLGLRRSGVAGAARSAAVGFGLAVAGTAVLLVAEVASLPFASQPVDDTGPALVGAAFGLGTFLAGIGLLVAGRGALRSGWNGWRRFTPLAAGGWTIVLVGVAATEALPTGVAIYGLCLLAIGVALYTTRASASPGTLPRPRAKTA